MDTNILDNINIKGDITNCKIDTLLKEVQKRSVFSFTQKTVYQNYNICTKEILNEYTVPEVTIFGGVVSFFGGFAILIFIILLICNIFDNY